MVMNIHITATMNTTSLIAMQALASIHEAISTLNHVKLEQLKDLEVTVIQSYYTLVKQNFLEQEQKISSLGSNVAATTNDLSIKLDVANSVVEEQKITELSTINHLPLVEKAIVTSSVDQKTIAPSKKANTKKPASRRTLTTRRTQSIETLEDSYKEMFNQFE